MRIFWTRCEFFGPGANFWTRCDVVEKKKAIAINVPENISFPDEELSTNPKKRSNFISRIWRSLPKGDKDDIITTIVKIALNI